MQSLARIPMRAVDTCGRMREQGWRVPDGGQREWRMAHVCGEHGCQFAAHQNFVYRNGVNNCSRHLHCLFIIRVLEFRDSERNPALVPRIADACSSLLQHTLFDTTFLVHASFQDSGVLLSSRGARLPPLRLLCLL